MNRRQLLATASVAAGLPVLGRIGSSVAQTTEGFVHVFYGGNGTTAVDSGLPRVGTIFGIAPDGDLHWYRYGGQGEDDPSGSLGWHANSGNPIGNGWQGMRHVFGGSSDADGFHGVVYGVDRDGFLHWYAYDGHGERDRSGALGWRANSGNVVGNGW